MKTKITFLAVLLLCGMSLRAQQQPPSEVTQPTEKGGKSMPTSKGAILEGKRVYKLIVQEGENEEEFNRGIKTGMANRGLLGDLVSLYRQTFVKKTAATASNWIELGFSSVSNSITNKQQQWETAIRKECTFERKLPMQQEILDFYRNTSNSGPLDPTDMLFSGFGCRQYILFPDSTQKEVFYISCKLRTDEVGKSRIINHSKFEVEVDSIMFNPSLCDLPNDSLGTNTETRIGFSFEKRKDLRFNLKATITSSWMTQAMQVYNDQYLGEFNISAVIDSQQIKDGIFTYSSKSKADKSKKVSVSGDCFLVPRSYIGCSEDGSLDSWGTGQYKVEMQISENCQINDNYYRKGDEWVKDRWQPEWKNIKQRKPAKSLWKQMMESASVQYVGNNWIATWIEPTKTAVLQINDNFFNAASSAMPTTTASPTAGTASPTAGTATPAAGAAIPVSGK